jgi:outer membrane protein
MKAILKRLIELRVIKMRRLHPRNILTYIPLLVPILICTNVVCQTSSPTSTRIQSAIIEAPRPAPLALPVQASATGQAGTNGPMRLSLQQAVRMALENNLDIQLQRIDGDVAGYGVTRAEGGGTPRAINYSVAETPVGEILGASPVLASTASTLSPNGIQPSAATVPSSYDVGRVLEGQHSLSIAPTAFSSGGNVPAFDLTLLGQFGWVHRNPTGSTVASTSATAADSVITNNTLGNTTLIKGFSPGTSIQLGVNDFVQSFYSGRSSPVPFSHPNAIALIAQPLLRGAGRANNTRYIAIAKTNKKISAAILEQQILSTVSGVASLYVDLLSFQNSVKVQQQVLKAANDLLSDNRQQLSVGRMPPIEITRSEALVASSELALVQARAQLEQEQNVLRSVLDPQSLVAPGATLVEIVATDELSPPPSDDQSPPLSELIDHAWAQRPDIRQSKLQIKNGERSVAASANARLPEVDLYGWFQSRGVIIPGLVPIAGDSLTGTPVIDPVPAGGIRSSRVFAAGIQFNLSVQNKVAEADLGADRALLRQERLRLTQMEAQAAAEVRNAVIGLNAAAQAARAATIAKHLQEQLLSAEIEKFRAGYATNFAVIEQQSFLAQAQTTEIVAQAAWKKARFHLDRALGDTLERLGISVSHDPSAAKPAP